MSKDIIIDLVYDGHCPLCNCTADYYRIKREVGVLNLVDSRTSTHPILSEITKRGIDLDEGMVIRKDNTYYHGKDALALMAKLSNGENWLSKLTTHLFSSQASATISYPYLKVLRNLLLRIKGVGQINNLDG